MKQRRTRELKDRNVIFRLPTSAVAVLDEEAEREQVSRSQFLRRIVLGELQQRAKRDLVRA